MLNSSIISSYSSSSLRGLSAFSMGDDVYCAGARILATYMNQSNEEEQADDPLSLAHQLSMSLIVVLLKSPTPNTSKGRQKAHG